MGVRSLISKIVYTPRFKRCGKNVYIEKPICVDYSSVSIGDNSHILKDSRIQNVSGVNNTKIYIGQNTGICYRFTALAGADIVIGNFVAIASDVFISSGSHGTDPESETPYGCQKYIGKPIIIEDGVWLGEKSCVLSGVTIGKKSIVGAGSVVTKDIPPYSIAVGNPAKVIKKYNFKTHKWIKIEDERTWD